MLLYADWGAERWLEHCGFAARTRKEIDMSNFQIDRRGFLRASAVAMAAPAMVPWLASNATAAGSLKGRIYLTLKYVMIREKELSMVDKF